MSQENVEVVREAVDAFNRQDRDAFVALAGSDVEWEDAIFWSEPARTDRARAELRAWFDQVVEPWERIHLDVDEITAAADDGVFFSLFITARRKSSGVEAPGLRVWSVAGSRMGCSQSARCFVKGTKPSQPRGCGSRRRSGSRSLGISRSCNS
jgi:ketosteroid isomerase-like protein